MSTPDETIAKPDLADKCASAVERAHGGCTEWPATQQRDVARTLREVLVHELQDLSEDLAREKERADKAELERDGYKHSANFHRERGITLLDAKWLDPACHKVCQSLVIKAKVAALEKELANQQSAADEAQLYRAELLRKLEAAEKELAETADVAKTLDNLYVASQHKLQSTETRLAALQGQKEKP